MTKPNYEKTAVLLREQIVELKAEIERLEKWQIKPTEAICLTSLSCRYKKVFKND